MLCHVAAMRFLTANLIVASATEFDVRLSTTDPVVTANIRTIR
jgi:hypothetical protein